jgi:hypothetical protein
MIETLSAIVANISEPGRILAFCDETDLTNEATSTMVADIHLHAAVVLPSDGYAALALELALSLKKFDVVEFHAVDIVMNGARSVWKNRDKANRLAALQTICGALLASCGHIYYVHVPKQQYAGFVAELPQGALPPNYKTAVKRCFRELIASLLNTPTPAIVIADKESNKCGLGLAKVDGGNHLLGNGIILAHSHEVLGIQLADAAAYVIGRYIRRRKKMIEVGLDDFDQIIAETVSQLHGRMHSLLSNQLLRGQQKRHFRSFEG